MNPLKLELLKHIEKLDEYHLRMVLSFIKAFFDFD